MFDTSAAGHDFNIDNGTFVVDASANRVGIGIATPTTKFHIFDGGTDTGLRIQSAASADNTSSITFDSRLADNSNKQATITAYRGNLSFSGDSGYGKVGIGTTTPSTLLHVNGALTATTIAGTLTTAAQTNITSVGTLSSILTAAAKIKLTDVGNATVAALQLTDAGLGISSPATDQMNFITADATRAVIDANGKVGIGSGATSPASLLHIDGAHSGGPIVTIHQTAGSSSADSGLDVETSSTGTIIQRWLNAGTPVMHVRGNGNVGIGPNTPQAKLDVQGIAMAERSRLSTNAGTTYWDLRRDSSSGHLVISDDGLGDVITVRQDTGNVGIGVTGPGALLSLPAGESNTPRFAIESAVDDNDFTITQYEDGNGTYTMLGQNVKLNSGGNNTVLDSAHRTAGIVLDSRNHGAITFITGAANTATEHIKIDSSGRLKIGTGSYTNTQYYAKDVVINAANEGGLTIANSANSHASYIMFADGVSSGSEQYAGYIEYNHNVDRFRVKSNGDFLVYGVSLGADALAVKSAGNVGIGTTNPLALLTIKGTGDAIRVESTNTGVGGAQLDLLHHTTSPADNDVPGALNFGGYYSGTNPAYSAAIRSEWKDVSSREGRLKFYTRNAGNFNTNMEISHNGIVRVAELADMNATGAVVMHRYNIGAIANYTKDLQEVTHAGIDHYTFTIQGNNTYQTLFNNVYSMGFEMIVQLGDAASRDQASYSVNATSPAYGVSTFNQNYYHNGGWNTGSFEFQMIATPGDNTEYSIQVKFTSYYSSSNNATGYVQIRRLY